MNDMFVGTILSTDNYSNILSAWSNQSVQKDIEFGSSSQYRTDVASDRQSLIDNSAWIITDAGEAQ